ncbi:MAG: GntR family transcriptional regulator [Clostridium sp.]
MNILLDYSRDIPMYEQIEEGIKNAILTGELKENDKLPSVRNLSAELKVSTITIKRAYLDLEKEGITYSVNGVGTFVKLKNTETLLSINREKLFDELFVVYQKIRDSGLSKAQIIEKIKCYQEA